MFSAQTHAQFPNLKMINWFEWDKDEAEVKGRVDWTVTSTPAIRDAFTAALRTGCAALRVRGHLPPGRLIAGA
ncbi:hypothetical protein [Arthrobacter sp. SLBN-112]|uniref:hypothetical protein n=1 Tax=Arthrobacter sp. SLBN-112 TaxID=2768452 RepID=UPI002810BF8C|nr:hypothetical protein [Arthrobacter sp. SLBN-112]